MVKKTRPTHAEQDEPLFQDYSNCLDYIYLTSRLWFSRFFFGHVYVEDAISVGRIYLIAFYYPVVESELTLKTSYRAEFFAQPARGCPIFFFRRRLVANG